MVSPESWETQRRALGELIRHQRRLARLSLRQLSALSNISNPYLSQVERGLHVPSVRVLQAIAEALDMSADSLLVQAGLLRAPLAGGSGVRDPEATEATEVGRSTDTERAVRDDRRLSAGQKEALIAVYRSYLAEGTVD